jgi:NAD(P)H-dependent flavin oxidoreductase YrpB (nitropropane dioxygenase family)
MRTILCDLLGIEVPIVQAPMAGGWTTPALVSAVSEAGGLGTLAGGRITAEELRVQIEDTRRRTGRPFGVNFLVPAPAAPGPDDAAALAVLRGIRERLGLPPKPPPQAGEPATAARRSRSRSPRGSRSSASRWARPRRTSSARTRRAQ